MSATSFNLLEALPCEVQYKVLNYLKTHDLHQLNCKSRAMRHLVMNFIGSNSQNALFYLSHHLNALNHKVLEIFLNNFLQPVTTKVSLYLKNGDPALCGLLKKVTEKFANVRSLTVDTTLTRGQLNAILAISNSLERLNFDGSLKEDESGERVEFPKMLRDLSFCCSDVNDQDLTSLSSCTTLTDLELTRCTKLTAKTLGSVVWPATLMNIEMRHCNIDSVGFKNILDRCTKLKSLDLTECEAIERMAFTEALYPATVTNLELSFTKIADNGLAQIFARCTHLTGLSLSVCRDISNAAFSKQQFPQSLETLELNGTKIDFNGLKNIFQQSKNLSKLNLSGCELITYAAFQELPFPQTLTELDVSHNDALIDAGLKNILARCSRLKELIIEKCPLLSREAFATCEFGPTLTRLDAADCSIDGKGLKNIVNRCQRLQTLYLENCSQIAPKDFQEAAFPASIQDLILSGVPLNADGLKNIYARCSDLESISLTSSAALREVKAPPLIDLFWHEPADDSESSSQAFGP